MKFSILVEHLGSSEAASLTNFPDRNPDLKGMAAIDAATPDTLSYIEGQKFARHVSDTQAGALILPQDPALQRAADERGIAWVGSAYPRLTFAQAIRLFYQPYRLAPGIDPSASIDPSVQMGEGVAIGANVVIQAGVVLGAGVCIFPNAVVYPEVCIGPRTVLHANCVIHERSQIGADCVIHSGAVIGAEGFGFVPVPEGWFKMEQSGVVVLEDGVEVGCNSTVDRPSVGETRLKRQTKLDNLVQVGHGCQVGEASVLASQTGLAGKVTLGKRVVLAGQVGIADGVSLGDGVIATAQAGVHRDVPAGQAVSSSPAVDNQIYLKASAVYKRLPEMYQTLKTLQKQMAAIEAHLAQLAENVPD